MKDNLLFVNQNKDIIREFLETVKEAEFDVDTTDNGLEAAVLLQKKKYKLVITGIDLATYDGTKIVEYVNEYCPETLCIVYTVRLELAHLKLLINERKVFRIFQRDVSYHGELQEAIIDAFTCYGKRELQAQNEQIMEKNLKNARTYLDEMKKVSAGRPGEREDFTKFAKALLEVFRREMEEALPREEAGQLIRYERKKPVGQEPGGSAPED